MLSQCTQSLFSNWNTSFTNASIVVRPINNQQSNFVQEMVSLNRQGMNQQFQRFFTKKTQLEGSNYKNSCESTIIFDPQKEKEYETRCEQGDIQAIIDYGESLVRGINGVKTDAKKAAKYFKIGSDKNDTRCMHDYATCLLDGIGVDVDVEQAASLFKEASKKGNIESMYLLYICYIKGAKLDKDEVFRYLKTSADKNYPYSCLFYGMTLIYRNDLIKSDIKKGVYYIKKASEQGLAPAQVEYAKLLLNGKLIPKDEKLAAHYFELSANSEDQNGCFYYAQMLMNNSNVKNRDINKASEYMKKAADLGNVMAMIGYSQMITNGLAKVPEGLSEAVNYLQKAIDQGSTAAMVFLAQMAEKGDGFSAKRPDLAKKYYKKAADVEKNAETYSLYAKFARENNDYSEMDKYMKLAAETGDAAALYDYGSLLYLSGEKIESIKYLKESAEKDHLDAMNLYAVSLIDQNPTESYKLLKKAIGKGSVNAMFNYASFLSKGSFDKLNNNKEGIKISNKENESFQYMKMAADKDNEAALLCIADWLFRGINCKKNINDSMKYYKKYADIYNGAEVNYIIGMCKIYGLEGCKVDVKLGLSYLNKAADQENPNAIAALAMIYYIGKYVKKDDKMAAKLFKKSADLGSTESMHSYAYCLAFGIGVDKNEKMAADYLKKGDENGDPYCTYYLGLMYMKGVGVEKNHDEGLKYLEKAKMKGIEHAVEIGERCYSSNEPFSNQFRID